jgi:Holliday junction resolvasome RuvABC endonuclease subunit
MDVLALDLGTKCGWAILQHGEIQSAVETFDLRRGESPGMRWLRYTRWLEEMTVHPVAGPLVELVVYEAAHHRGGAATEIAAGFATHTQAVCARHGIEHASVHTATLKRFTTSKGNASKTEMLEAVARRWKRVDTDDEGDALALLHYSLAELLPSVALAKVCP